MPVNGSSTIKILPVLLLTPNILQAVAAMATLMANSASKKKNNARMSISLTPSVAQLVAHDRAAFHDEADALKFRDVCERVAGCGDDVGVLARFERAHIVRLIE